MNNSADALFALNALLSAAGGGNAVPTTSSSSSTASNDNLANLLETLASFSAQVGGGDSMTATTTTAEEESRGGHANSTMAELLLAQMANAAGSADQPTQPATLGDFERYEREREQKFRELETRFSLFTPRVLKVAESKPTPTQHQQSSSSAASSSKPTSAQPSSNQQTAATMAAAGKAFANSAMAELLSGFHKSQLEKKAATAMKETPMASSSAVSSSLKPIATSSSSHKRRNRSSRSSSRSSRGRRSRSRSRSSRSSSEFDSESSYTSSSESDRSRKAARKKRMERKKKPKKSTTKTKEKKQKSSSDSKQSKAKKDLLEAEKKAISEQISTLSANLTEYDQKRRMFEDELSRLKKQHNEMCRKLQRQNSDPKRDPLIINNESIQADLDKYLKEVQKQKEDDEKRLADEEKRLEKLKKHGKLPKKGDMKKAKTDASSSTKKNPKQEENVEYVDAGSHWCKHCETTSKNVFEWLEHLHSREHKSKMDTLNRPWMPPEARAPVKKENIASLKPLKGTEFLMPSTAFYCNLCKEFSGDIMSADVHLKSSGHNQKYEAFIDSNPFYERREQLEKAAAVSHRLEKSTSSTNNEDKKPLIRQSATAGNGTIPKKSMPIAQRVPHKPNQSGQIKPFHVTTSAAVAEKKEKMEERKDGGLGFGVKMKINDPKKKKPTSTSRTSSSTAFKKPHSAFADPREKEKSRYETGGGSSSSRRYSPDRKRHRDH